MPYYYQYQSQSKTFFLDGSIKKEFKNVVLSIRDASKVFGEAHLRNLEKVKDFSRPEEINFLQTTIL